MERAGEKRLCEKCDKHITDFRWMSVVEIAMTHAKSETAVCGLYSPHQLELQNRKTPKPSLLSTTDATAQNPTGITPIEQAPVPLKALESHIAASESQAFAKRDSIIISGKATFIRENGLEEPVMFASICVKHTEIVTATDFDGNYSLDISVVPDSLDEITLVFSLIGLARVEMLVPNKEAVEVSFLSVPQDNMIVFGVTIEKVPPHKRFWKWILQPFKK